MRYGQHGGYTPAGQQRRERLRLEAADRFAAGDGTGAIARDLRVTPGSVRRWRRAWRQGGPVALKSKGPVSAERLSPAQWARLETELRRGPLAHGFADDQRWTLSRVKTLIGAPELADFATENAEWLRIYQLPAYAPELNPAEGIWSLLKRAIANFAAPNLDYLVRIVKRKLKKIRYRPDLITGCLAATGLTIEA
jgi:transposase